MPFGLVSGVGLGIGVLDFGGDRRRGRGSLGVNTMQKWRIIVNIPGCLPEISQWEREDGGYLVTTCQTFPPRAVVKHWQG